MRSEIKEILNKEIETINNRTYEPSAAGPNLKKPFLVLREGVQSNDEPYAGFTTIYEVWPYVERTTFQNVDSLSQEVIEAVDKKRFDSNGIPHFIEYTGSLTDDIVDEEWDVLTRGLRFRVFSLAWLIHEPVEPDPVEAMKAWTEHNFENMQTNPEGWDPQNSTPGAYWRVSSIQSVTTMNWGAWINASLRGHLISPSIKEQGKWLDMVIRKLAIDAETRMSDNSKMTFQSASADGSFDPFGSGQIQLNVRFGVLREKEKLPHIKHAYFDEKRGGQVHDD